MKLHMKRTVLKLIALVAALSAIYILISVPISKQERNLAASRRHLTVLESLVHKEGRFHNILLEYSTAGGLWVSGNVQSEGELKDLKLIVDGSKPPVPVGYQVTVAPKSLDKPQK